MLKRNLLISVFLLLQCTLLLYAIIPASVFFVNETYKLEKTTQEEEGIKYQFKGTKEYPYEDHSIHRTLSFLKYEQPKDDFSAKPLELYKSFKEVDDVKNGFINVKLKRCKDDTILLEVMINHADKTPCGGGLTRYTSQGEIEAFNLKSEFLEIPFEKYSEALCELKMI